MAHLRVHLSNEAFARLRELSGRTGRSAVVEGSLVLEATLLGVAADPGTKLTNVSILLQAEDADSREPLVYSQSDFDAHMAGLRRRFEVREERLRDRLRALGETP